MTSLPEAHFASSGPPPGGGALTPESELLRVVDVRLRLASLPSDAVEALRAWIAHYFDDTPTESMWVPVGKVGPVVILGHSDPDNAPNPTFPLWLFGLVRIDEVQHASLARQIAELLRDCERLPLDMTKERIPTARPTGQSFREVVEMCLGFPGAEQDAFNVRAALTESDDDGLLKSLPEGWREAVIALAGGHPLIDAKSVLPAAIIGSAVPETFCRAHDLIPLDLGSDLLTVACPIAPGGADEHGLQSIWKAERTGNAARVRLNLVLTGPGAFAAHERTRSAGSPASLLLSRGGRSASVTVRAKVAIFKKEVENLRIDSPAIEERTLLNVALYQAIKAKASDLHIDIGSGGATGQLRIRHDGRLVPLGLGRFALNRLPAIIQLLRLLIDITGGDLTPADGKFSMRVDEDYYDVRVSILPSPDSVTTGHGFAVLRFLKKSGAVAPLADIVGENKPIFDEILEKPHGLVLVTGPTGSGKTTTLNAMIQALHAGKGPDDEGAKKILTIEDPVEYVIDGVQQVSVTKALSFAEAIRRFLRQDPDVILVGEIRDLETANVAINASRTGHLVFSTLHTNGAAETVSRLVNIGVPHGDLDGPLLAVIAQRLMPKLCPNCRKSRSPSMREQKQLESLRIPVPAHVCDPNHRGCGNCEKGYRGRTAVFEVVKINRAIRNAITAKLSEDELRAKCEAEGFRSLLYQAMVLFAAGGTGFADARDLNSSWD